MASEALAARELTRNDLRRQYVKLHRNVYVLKGVSLTARDRAYAAWLWSGRRAVVAGTSAAAMHGARWLPTAAPAELTRARCSAASGIVIHRETLRDDEVCLIQSLDCTTVARTPLTLVVESRVTKPSFASTHCSMQLAVLSRRCIGWLRVIPARGESGVYVRCSDS